MLAFLIFCAGALPVAAETASAEITVSVTLIRCGVEEAPEKSCARDSRCCPFVPQGEDDQAAQGGVCAGTDCPTPEQITLSFLFSDE
ncbi:MAG: hypothetical protein HYU57_01705 [Micavibrio aeruginosavorus]|nr:hypothetical protein [Micavibrio aeruginosavorus]